MGRLLWSGKTKQGAKLFLVQRFIRWRSGNRILVFAQIHFFAACCLTALNSIQFLSALACLHSFHSFPHSFIH